MASGHVNAGGLHFEVGYPMGPVGEAGEAVDELGLAETKAEDA